MNLAGQGAERASPTATRRLDDGGYIMVVLLIGMAVTAVWMGAMLPSWRQQATREREADLIFRGEQYARAIALYYRRNQNLPSNIDVLVSQRYLRKKYRDPIADADFLPIGGMTMGGGRQGSPPGLGQPGTGRQGAQPPAQSQPQGRATLGQQPANQGQGPLGQPAGISGVRSTSNATSIVVYSGQQSYSQFPFDYAVALQRMGAGLPRAPQEDPQGPNRGRGAGGPGRGRDTFQPLAPGVGRGGRGTVTP